MKIELQNKNSGTFPRLFQGGDSLDLGRDRGGFSNFNRGGFSKFSRLLLILAAIFLLSSCLTVQKIERNCDKFAQICVSDKKTEIHYRDSVILFEKTIYINKYIDVPVPRDSVAIRDSVRIINGFASMKSIHKEQGIIAVDASIYKSELSIIAYLTDSSILYNYIDTLNYADSIRIFNAIKETTTTGTVVITQKYIPWPYKFTFWVFIIILIGGVAYIAWSVFFKKFTLKHFKP